jgi:hypothetical protein
LSLQDATWRLAGAAVFAHEGRPCLLNYDITCDATWKTQTGSVTGWVGGARVAISIARDDAGLWRLNGKECPEVAGCSDIDLNFSPATNLLPIRRLGLFVGQAADVRAAWLRFPEFTLEPLDQVYRRASESVYRYEALGGVFIANLSVNAAGYVTHYPDLWVADTGSE